MTNSDTVGKLYSVSYSKLNTYKRCRQQFHWKYVDKFFPPSTLGQTRGTAGHAALAVWHREYKEDDAITAAWQVWEQNGLPSNEEWDILYESLRRYVAWSKQHDTFKLVEAEQEFEIQFDPIPGAELQFASFTLGGFIDGIVKDGKQTWLLENKFHKRMDNHPLDLDFQVSVYMLASLILKYNVSGVIYNIVRVADTKIAVTEPVVRRRIRRNPAGLAYIQTEILRQVREMQDYQQKGGLPYRNPTKDCSWDCPFYQPCLSLTDDSVEPTTLLHKIAQTRSTEDGETIVQEW